MGKGGKGGRGNPNYPSTTGNPSGKGRGNTPKNQRRLFSKSGLAYFVSFLARAEWFGGCWLCDRAQGFQSDRGTSHVYTDNRQRKGGHPCAFRDNETSCLRVLARRVAKNTQTRSKT